MAFGQKPLRDMTPMEMWNLPADPRFEPILAELGRRAMDPAPGQLTTDDPRVLRVIATMREEMLRAMTAAVRRLEILDARHGRDSRN
jgi:hypothetical protein